MSQYVSALGRLHSDEVLKMFWFPSFIPEVGGLWSLTVVFPEVEVRNMDTWVWVEKPYFAKAGPAALPLTDTRGPGIRVHWPTRTRRAAWSTKGVTRSWQLALGAESCLCPVRQLDVSTIPCRVMRMELSVLVHSWGASAQGGHGLLAQ